MELAYSKKSPPRLGLDWSVTFDKAQKLPPDTLIYVLDAANIIIEIGGAWDGFAAHNDGYAVFAKNVIGSTFTDFISGRVTRQYWLDLFVLIRTVKKPVALNYRCDSPYEKRIFRMTLQPEAEDKLRLISTCVLTERRPRPLFFHTAKQRSRHTLLRCSQCNGIQHHGQWLEADEFAKRQRGSQWSVVYGLCPPCREQFTLAGAKLRH
ncbi:MAG: hypothetical protein RQ715_02405 [Methylococcales bacterium]|nr:hypothetical protein [Methylococcales bacterium]